MFKVYEKLVVKEIAIRICLQLKGHVTLSSVHWHKWPKWLLTRNSETRLRPDDFCLHCEHDHVQNRNTSLWSVLPEENYYQLKDWYNMRKSRFCDIFCADIYKYWLDFCVFFLHLHSLKTFISEMDCSLLC